MMLVFTSTIDVYLLEEQIIILYESRVEPKVANTGVPSQIIDYLPKCIRNIR